MTEPPAGRRAAWPTFVAWAVILGVVAFILYRQATRQVRDRAASLVLLQAQGRLIVGLKNLGFPAGSAEQLLTQTTELVDPKNYSERLRLAILGGELVGPDEALQRLANLEEERKAGEVEAREPSVEAVRLLRSLYVGYDEGWTAPWLPPDEQATLREGLGWFGELALAPKDGDEAARSSALRPAYRTVVGYLTMALGLLACFAVGLFLILLVFCLAVLGHVRPKLSTAGGAGGVYAETFALYMLAYLGIAYLFRLIPPEWGGLWLGGVAMLLSLVALAWPVVRGVPWQQVRRDLGLGVGERPLAEILFGAGCYLTAVPVLAAGSLILFFLSKGRPAGSGPTHPIMGEALQRGWWVWVQVFVLACVLAPLVEEIMFRGALYRHLREVSAGWGRFVSVALSALVSSFIFAVIHPQGWLAVPALGGLAFVFALAREWRASLLPPMIAHGLNNGVTTLLLLVMAG